MKALITGAEGFLGSHLAELLVSEGLEVYGTVHCDRTENLEAILDDITLLKLNINDRENVFEVIRQVKPDYVFHLAAQAYVMPSWQDMEGTIKTNVFGTIYLLDAVKEFCPNASIVIASSSAGYGLTHSHELPITETKEFRPSSPYAVSKIGTDMISYLYYRTHSMKIIRARLFNSVGPRKKGSAIADFARAIASIERGESDKLMVGNLNVTIDLTDGRDSVKALWLLAQKGAAGDAYNICSGKGRKLEEVLNMLASMSTSNIDIEQDPAKFRPLDDSVFIGDNSKLSMLGWKQEITLEKMLGDTLDYWRQKDAY